MTGKTSDKSYVLFAEIHCHLVQFQKVCEFLYLISSQKEEDQSGRLRKLTLFPHIVNNSKVHVVPKKKQFVFTIFNQNIITSFSETIFLFLLTSRRLCGYWIILTKLVRFSKLEYGLASIHFYLSYKFLMDKIKSLHFILAEKKKYVKLLK